MAGPATDKTTDILSAAEDYLSRGISCIPVDPKSKKPLIKWQTYQTEMPMVDEWETWARTFKNCGVGLVTGRVSNLYVIDIDSRDGKAALAHIITFKEDRETTIVRTQSGGWHLYYTHDNGTLPNNCKVIKDCDFRGDGGYVVAPPSEGYRFVVGRGLEKMRPLPASYIDIVQRGVTFSHAVEESVTDGHTRVTGCHTQKPSPYIPSTRYSLGSKKEKDIAFDKGTRNESIFKIAQVLRNGQLSDQEASLVCSMLARSCGLPEKEALKTVESAYKGPWGDRNLSQEIKDWVFEQEPGVNWSVTECDKTLLIVTKRDKTLRRKVFQRLRDAGEIRQEKSGKYQRIEMDMERIDLMKVEISDQYKGLKWPFMLEEQVTLYPGNIAVVAGAANAGKTAFLLNLAEYNMRDFKIHYITSEMGGEELNLRLSDFQTPIKDFNEHVQWWERSSDFADPIKADPDAIWIIDYLELTDEFWKVGEILRQVHDNLGRGLAVVALQKDSKARVGRGGEFSLEKPRLYLSIDSGLLRIIKAKIWGPKAKAEQVNPNGKEYRFKLVGGHKFMEL